MPVLSQAQNDDDGGREKSEAVEQVGHSPQESSLSIDTNRLIERIKRKDRDLHLDVCYDILSRWIDEARNRSRLADNLEAAKRAQEVLDALESNRLWSFATTKNYKARHTILVPSRPVFYEMVLQAYASCGGRLRAAEAAEQLLDRMMDQCLRYQRLQQRRKIVPVHRWFPKPPEPTTKTFNMVINVWAKSGADDAGLRAENVLSKMEQWKRTCSNDTEKCYQGCVPNVRTWSTLINVWSRRSTDESRTRVLELLHKAKQVHEETKQWIESQGGRAWEKGHNKDLLVTTDVCNAALKVFVDPSLGREGARQAEQVLRFYQQWHEMDWLVSPPNVRSFTLVLDAWAQCGTEEGANRAQVILNAMIADHIQGKGGVIPNRITFTSCITAWARLQKPQYDTPEKAEAILLQLVQMYDDLQDETLRPDTNICNAVISCWIRAIIRPDAIDRARQVFDQAKNYAQPDLVTYNILLDGLNKRGRGADALDLLLWLESSSTTLEPDRISYNSTLAAVAKDPSMGPPDALAIFEKMKNPPVSDNSRQGLIIKPDLISYMGVLAAWKNCESITIDDAVKAAMLVKEMEEATDGSNMNHEETPDVYLLTILIHVCAKVRGQNQEDYARALQIALDTMEKMLQGVYGQPTSSAYEAIMHCICLLCQNEHEKVRLLNFFFDQCALNGYISTNVVRLMEEGKTPKDPNELDESWSRNVETHHLPNRTQSS